MRMIFLLVALAAPLAAAANDHHPLMGYECDIAAARLVITLEFVPVTSGARHDPTHWDPGELISMKNDDHIGALKTVRGGCELAHATYALKFGPVPQNMNIGGQCGGADIGAWVEVRRNDKLLLPRYEMGPFCPGDALVTTRIEFSAGAPPVFTKVSGESFYR